MTKLRGAAQAALDALEVRCGTNADERGPTGAITLLYAALALPAEQAHGGGGMSEPVAYFCPHGCGCLWRDNRDGSMSLYGRNSKSCEKCERLPLNSLLPLYSFDTIAALLDEVERLNSPVVLSEWQKLVAERDALTRRLDEVREIYAGMEGFVPQTAPEGYCLRIIKQMAHAAMKGASDDRP